LERNEMEEEKNEEKKRSLTRRTRMGRRHWTTKSAPPPPLPPLLSFFVFSISLFKLRSTVSFLRNKKENNRGQSTLMHQGTHRRQSQIH